METGRPWRRETALERIYANCIDVLPSGCRIWMGATCAGYGCVTAFGKSHRLHRLVWDLVHGEAAPPLIMHRCDTPSCVNINHLHAGTHKENTIDAVRKGRWRAAGKRGEASHLAKLTEREAMEILHSAESTRALADRFGVQTEAVRRIRTGERWPHLQSIGG